MRDSTGFSQCGSHREYNAGCGFCEGETVIRHAAKEPEIVDLQNFLVGMGADVSGAGTSTITIRGTNRKLNNVEHTVIPDRIVAVLYIFLSIQFWFYNPVRNGVFFVKPSRTHQCFIKGLVIVGCGNNHNTAFTGKPSISFSIAAIILLFSLSIPVPA